MKRKSKQEKDERMETRINYFKKRRKKKFKNFLAVKGSTHSLLSSLATPLRGRGRTWEWCRFVKSVSFFLLFFFFFWVSTKSVINS